MNLTKPNRSKQQNLQNLRHHIDKVDTQIVELLSQRQKLVKKVAQLKKHLNLPTRQKGREAQLLKAKRLLAKKLHLNQRFIQNLFKHILAESRKTQSKIQQGTNL